MIQTTITTFGTIGLAIEIASCIINNTIMLCSEIISLDCSEISTKLNNGTTSKVDNFAQLRNEFMKFEELDQYILEMSELNYWRMFSAPVLIVYSVSMSIFCQIAVNNFKKHETNSKLKAN